MMILMGFLIIFLLSVMIGLVIGSIIKDKKVSNDYKKLPLEDKKRIEEMHLTLKALNTKLISKDIIVVYKLIQNLLNNLMNDENVLYFTTANLRANDYIYITNKRIIMLGDVYTKTIMIEKINSIKKENTTKIEIVDNSEKVIIYCNHKEDVEKFIKTTIEEMDKHKTINININQIKEKDIFDKIARLKALYDEGILTEFEFNMKKMELLDKNQKNDFN